MITTLFLLLLIAFQTWYWTSEKAGHKTYPSYLEPVFRNKQNARLISGALMLSGLVLFVIRLGLMSGLVGGIIGLMCAGCLVVLIRPYRYLNLPAVIVLYLLFVTLEFFI